MILYVLLIAVGTKAGATGMFYLLCLVGLIAKMCRGEFF